MNRIVAFTLAALVAVVGWSLTTEETHAAHGCGHRGHASWNFPVARGVYRVLGFERRQARRAERRAARHATHGCSGDHGCAAECSGGHVEPPAAASVAPVCPTCTAASKSSECPGGVCPRPNS